MDLLTAIRPVYATYGEAREEKMTTFILIWHDGFDAVVKPENIEALEATGKIAAVRESEIYSLQIDSCSDLITQNPGAELLLWGMAVRYQNVEEFLAANGVAYHELCVGKNIKAHAAPAPFEDVLAFVTNA